MLCRVGDLTPEASVLVERVRDLGIQVDVESAREMRRMSAGDDSPELIALAGAKPKANLDEWMAGDGLAVLLVGLRYPGNVGFILRSAEVAGAAGVIVASDWTGSQLSEAKRIGMRADRFFPVVECTAMVAIKSARQAGRRVVALETSGDKVVWQADLALPTLVVVGSETTGIADSILELVDDVIRIPTRGFIPSYNVQAAVSMILGDWLRQNSD